MTASVDILRMDITVSMSVNVMSLTVIMSTVVYSLQQVRCIIALFMITSSINYRWSPYTRWITNLIKEHTIQFLVFKHEVFFTEYKVQTTVHTNNKTVTKEQTEIYDVSTNKGNLKQISA